MTSTVMPKQKGEHAVVLAASMTELLAARVLIDARRHETARCPTQLRPVRRASRMIIAALAVTVLCAACQFHPSHSPIQKQNPEVQSSCVPGPGAHCGGGTGRGGGTGT
jgi:hypothetical protein